MKKRLARSRIECIGEVNMKMEKYYENPEILHVGTEETRCYYEPKRINGDCRMQKLSEMWRFHYYSCIEELEKDFYLKDLTQEKVIQVPSCWQNAGYDKHQYINFHFPIPADPPYVPDYNPCGLYETFFEAVLGERQYLYFEGVDSCFYVWLNGKFVGYSQVSHSPSEFEITDYVVEDENRLHVLVFKWCDGTYLEDQDKFRMSGIFRDVWLISRAPVHIRDYTIRTCLKGLGEAQVAISLHKSTRKFIGELSVSLQISDQENRIISQKNCLIESEEDELEELLEIPNATLWNAEKPYLYTLQIMTKDEIISQRIGVREITVDGQIVKINGKPVKLLGVNRHDSDARTGYTISREQVLADLKLMKENNINTIRTSHYPNAPWFVEYCDEYGFYVIDEADIEMHGVVSQYGGYEEDIYCNYAMDPLFETAIMDRIERCVIRDKNAASVIMWSLGNESGFGTSFEKSGRWVKEYDPTRLVHYEGSVYQSKNHKNDTSRIDVYSNMYPSIDQIEQYFLNTENKKPYFMCEFVHAMGNGPGGIKEYVAHIYENDGFLGGCVWEWCDHAIFDGYTEEGKERYLYGGDHGEKYHDGNFCVDGLLYPNRKPHTGLGEWKNSISPVKISVIDMQAGIFKLENRYDFWELAEEVAISYEITAGGELEQGEKIVCSGKLEVPVLKPHHSEEIKISIPHLLSEDCDIYVRFIYRQKHDKTLIKQGHEIGFSQFCIKEREQKNISIETQNKEMSAKKIELIETQNYWMIEGTHFSYAFGKKTGNFVKLEYDKKNILDENVTFQIYRAPTDNDMNIKEEWEKAGYKDVIYKIYALETKVKEDNVEIHVKIGAAAVYRRPVLKMDVIWQINSYGEILCIIEADKDTDMPFLPRLGMQLPLQQHFRKVTYYGYGPTESYIDKIQNSYVGEFTSTVEEMHENYIRPQENGSRYRCRYVRVDGNGLAMNIEAEEYLDFNISDYTIEELESKKHDFELKKSGYTILNLDQRMSGIGTASCGHPLLEKYRREEAHSEWKIKISFSKL